MKPLGWILFLLGLAAAGYGLAALVKPDLVAGTPLESQVGSGATLALGAVALVIGLVMITRKGPAPPPPAPEPPPPEPERVEIKRTQMDWGDKQTVEDTATPALEDIRRQQAQLKVQLGLGQISPDAYKRLSADLSAREAALEQQRREAQA